MKVIQHNGKFTFEVEGGSAVECFDQLAKLNSTFNVPDCNIGDEENVDSTNYEPSVREVPDPKNPKNVYTYREFRSKVYPYARLNMGQHRTGDSLFPKGNWETAPTQAEA